LARRRARRAGRRLLRAKAQRRRLAAAEQLRRRRPRPRPRPRQLRGQAPRRLRRLLRCRYALQWPRRNSTPVRATASAHIPFPRRNVVLVPIVRQVRNDLLGAVCDAVAVCVVSEEQRPGLGDAEPTVRRDEYAGDLFESSTTFVET